MTCELPLFHYREVRNGTAREITIGPSVARAITRIMWIVLIGLLTITRSFDAEVDGQRLWLFIRHIVGPPVF